MRLIVYPLTYKGSEARKKAVSEAVDLAEKITDERLLTEALSGILVFSDKVISQEDAERPPLSGYE